MCSVSVDIWGLCGKTYAQKCRLLFIVSNVEETLTLCSLLQQRRWELIVPLRGNNTILQTAMRKTKYVRDIKWVKPQLILLPLPVGSRWSHDLYSSFMNYAAWTNTQATGSQEEKDAFVSQSCRFQCKDRWTTESGGPALRSTEVWFAPSLVFVISTQTHPLTLTALNTSQTPSRTLRVISEHCDRTAGAPRWGGHRDNKG